MDVGNSAPVTLSFDDDEITEHTQGKDEDGTQTKKVACFIDRLYTGDNKQGFKGDVRLLRKDGDNIWRKRNGVPDSNFSLQQSCSASLQQV
ncbi:hypothetical protein AVEN_52281-1 [Araneus ventricosus]|uniref:Uncharacterized protein n=1 Tax=Araneus ventricosus TaxID=182803 RepID=A0A4Y2QWE3_ARAVE|nr:hypothetical protein AVEN_52281-1 [Araneus ventricosus]